MTTIKRTNVIVGAEGQTLPIPIDSQAPRAVILTGPGFQDHDVIYCYYRCLEQRYHVDIATPGATPVVGKYTVPLNGKMDKTGAALISFEDLKDEKYGCVAKNERQSCSTIISDSTMDELDSFR
jgi:putative intracellular protease/amidase